MSYQGLDKYAKATVAGAGLIFSLASGACKVVNQPPSGASVLIVDLQRCPFDYDDLLEKWLKGENESSGIFARVAGDGIVHKYNPNFPIFPENLVALPDLDGNHRFFPQLEGCGTIVFTNYDSTQTPKKNLQIRDSERNREENTPAFPPRAPEVRNVWSGKYRRGHENLPQQQKRFIVKIPGPSK